MAIINIDSMIKSRFLPIEFTIEFDDGKKKTIHLELKSMKMKALRKVRKLQKEEDDEKSIREMFRIILDNNTNNYKLRDTYIDEITVDQMKAIGQAYTKWVEDNQKN